MSGQRVELDPLPLKDPKGWDGSLSLGNMRVIDSTLVADGKATPPLTAA